MFIIKDLVLKEGFFEDISHHIALDEKIIFLNRFLIARVHANTKLIYHDD